MCRMQKIYLSQLLVLMGMAPFAALLFLDLLDGLAAQMLACFLFLSFVIAAFGIEAIGKRATFLNERDRQIRKSAFELSLRFFLILFFIVFFLGVLSLDIFGRLGLIDEPLTIVFTPKHLSNRLFMGSLWLLLCARDVAGLVLYRRGGSVARPGTSPNSEHPVSFGAR